MPEGNGGSIDNGSTTNGQQVNNQESRAAAAAKFEQVAGKQDLDFQKFEAFMSSERMGELFKKLGSQIDYGTKDELTAAARELLTVPEDPDLRERMRQKFVENLLWTTMGGIAAGSVVKEMAEPIKGPQSDDTSEVSSEK
jgi:hypothetical protein